LIGDCSESGKDGIEVRRSERFTLISLSVSDAVSMEGVHLEEAAAEAYREVARVLLEDGPWHPIRFWNFVPGILGDGGAGMDRYMRFNIGRHRAFSEWFGGQGRFNRVLPTASGVGHKGRDLVIHALACREPGKAVSNPRQRAPHHYSKRFGPMPPCFARATLLHEEDGNRLLLVGGTASIRGEESVHIGDLKAQLNETFENLSALVRNAFHAQTLPHPLHHLRDLRVYHAPTSDLAYLRLAVAESFQARARVEWIAAELCRQELLVEIEGLASEK
jgi:hypothetical protein